MSRTLPSSSAIGLLDGQDARIHHQPLIVEVADALQFFARQFHLAVLGGDLLFQRRDFVLQQLLQIVDRRELEAQPLFARRHECGLVGDQLLAGGAFAEAPSGKSIFSCPSASAISRGALGDKAVALRDKHIVDCRAR